MSSVAKRLDVVDALRDARKRLRTLELRGPGRAVSFGVTFPPSPADGDEHIYPASTAEGVMWRFRYRVAGTAGKKWECIGAVPLLSVGVAAASVDYSATGYGTATGTQPSIAAPFSGDYLVRFGSNSFHTASGGTLTQGLSVNGGAPTAGTDEIALGFGTGNTDQNANSRTIAKTVATAGHVIDTKWKASGATGKIRSPWIELLPVRVSG